ncbi:MAG: alpha/beta hydrolase [Solirubrobacteraceae bacterium]
MSRRRLILDFLDGGRPHRYGPDHSQRAELHLPGGPGPHAVMVLIHGGSWQSRYGKIVMRGLAGDLRRRGWAAWNIEYRRLGNGGGWPATFEDVARAIDHLAELEAPLDLARVSLLGHSAGGHLALWAATRNKLPPGAPGAIDGHPPLAPRHVIAQAGVCDLAGAYALWHGGAARALMGGGPDELPERYALGDPLALAPPDMPVLLVHGVSDEVVSVKLSRSYALAARAGGGEVELVEIEGLQGRHRSHIDPRGAAWAAVTERLEIQRADLLGAGASQCQLQ